MSLLRAVKLKNPSSPVNNITLNADGSVTFGAGATGSGTGDMTKSVYDTNNNGQVDHADLADSVPLSGVPGLQTALDSKAPISSPTLTGTPTAPTASAGDSSSKLATTEFVANEILSLVANTLDNDPNFGANILAALATKAPKDSPVFSGTPSTPTPLANALSNQVVNVQYVTQKISAAIADVVASAPGALDTLKELADALGGDANFSATITNSLATKAPLASPVFTGQPEAPTASVGNNSTRVATTAFVSAAIAKLLNDTFNNDANFATTIATALAGKLSAANNLSDVANPSDARVNLGLGSMATKTDTDYVPRNATANITKGYTFTPKDLGVVSGGTLQLDPTVMNDNYYTNNGAHTILAPTTDCKITLLITNGASAGAITLTGFTAKVDTTYNTTLGNSFFLTVVRINGVSGFAWMANQ